MHPSPPPFEIRRVLVGVDADRHGDPALRRGLEFASLTGCDLRIVHAVPIVRPRWWKADRGGFLVREAEAIAAATRTMTRRVGVILEEGGWTRTEARRTLRVTSGNPARVLCDEAERFGADLILVGPHARRGVVDFGNTHRGLLAHARCPVWIQIGEPRSIERVVCPIDLGEESVETLAAARTVAAALEAPVLAVHCFPGPAFAYSAAEHTPGPTYAIDAWRDESKAHFEEVLARFDWGGVAHEARFLEAEIVPGILDQHRRGDLIVLGTHDAGAFSSAVLGGTAYGVLRDAETPVLAVRHAPRKVLEHAS